MKRLCKISVVVFMILIFNQMLFAVLHQSLPSRQFNKEYFEFQAQRQKLLAEDKEAAKKNLAGSQEKRKKKPLEGKGLFYQTQPSISSSSSIQREKSSGAKKFSQLTPVSPKVVVGPNREKELAAQKAALELRRRLAALELAESSSLAIKPGSVQSPDPVPSIRKSPVIVDRTVADDKSALDRQYTAYQKLHEGLRALELSEASRLASKQTSNQSESDLMLNVSQPTRIMVQPGALSPISAYVKKSTKKTRKINQPLEITIDTLQSGKNAEG